MQEDISVSPLYPPDAKSPDAATERAVEAWAARRKAEAIAEATAPPFPRPSTETIRYLEGIWLVGKEPDKGACLTNWYDGKTQIEFEFRKSGGRFLIFEPPDLFTAITITGVEKTGNDLVL